MNNLKLYDKYKKSKNYKDYKANVKNNWMGCKFGFTEPLELEKLCSR